MYIKGLKFTYTQFKGGEGSGHHGHTGGAGGKGKPGGSVAGTGTTTGDKLSSAERTFLQRADLLMKEHAPKEFAASLVPDDSKLGFRIGSRVKRGTEIAVSNFGLRGSSESGMIHSHPGKKWYPSNSDVKVLSKISRKRQARGWHFAIIAGGQIRVWSGKKRVDLKSDRQLYAAVRKGLVREQIFRLSDLK